jgi:phage terminase large subunit-like protein
VVTAVDTAYSVKSWADYTVAMTALIFGGRFYVINMVRGKYNEYDLPKVIANVGYKWKPKRIAIEDSVGVKWMGRELRREMDALKISIPVEFCSLGYGTKLRSKQLKAKPVLRLLGDERLYFLNSCEGLAEIYTEMEQFTGTSDDKHDDIVSAISLLVEQFGGYADMDRKISIASSDFAADAKSKARHDMIYCAGEYASLNQNGSEDPKTAYALLNSPAQQVQEKYADPFSDLMG